MRRWAERREPSTLMEGGGRVKEKEREREREREMFTCITPSYNKNSAHTD